MEKLREKPWELQDKTPYGKAILVGEIVDEYFHSNQFHRLAPSTKRVYQSVLRTFQSIPFNRYKSIFYMKAYKVDYALVDYLVRVMHKDGKVTTASSYFAVMSSVWKYAVRGGRVYYNPWLKPGLQRCPERDTTWTKSEIEKVIAAAKAKGFDLLALYITLCYETAQRPWQDLRNLKWDSIKEINGSLALDLNVSKTNTHLVIPLTAPAIAALNEQPKEYGYIFVTKRGRRLTSRGLTKQLEIIKKETGLRSDLLFRDLRRTAFTEMAMSGCTPLEIEAISGWRCPDAVLRRYARVRFETAKNAQAKRQQLQESA